jgi:hypothetical protein
MQFFQTGLIFTEKGNIGKEDGGLERELWKEN